MTFNEARQNPLFLTLSESNKKLIPNKDTKFLIWNLPSKITCPFAAEHCKHFCYAVKAETAYPTCLPSRMKHLEESQQADFVQRMIFTIEAYLNRPSYRNAKKIVVRIHESGDFYNQRYADKWIRIMEHFVYDKRIVFMAYTKSIEFLLNVPSNAVVRFSVWDDTATKFIQLAKYNSFPIYTAVDKFTEYSALGVPPIRDRIPPVVQSVPLTN